VGHPRAGIVVGAGADAGFKIEDASVSRKHAQLIPVPGGVHVMDMGSTNGTVFEGVKISQKVVPLGSMLTMGKAKIELVRCVFRKAFCHNRRNCVLRKRLKRIEETVIAELGEITIGSLVDDISNQRPA